MILWRHCCRMLLWVAAPPAVTASVQHMWGPTATFVLMGQALTAVVLLEAVNFVEHYGLQRKHLPSGRWGMNVSDWLVKICGDPPQEASRALRLCCVAAAACICSPEDIMFLR